MRMSSSRYLAVALAAGMVLATGGCAKTGTTDLPYVARDVSTLYIAAQKRLDQGQYKLAAALFDEVERQHPFSIWARRAELMGAFAHYKDDDYTQAISSAQRFIAEHPGSPEAAYAYYLVGVSNYDQIADVQHDQKTTQAALDTLGELIRRYPDSRYAADARLKLDLVRDHLAGKEMEVGRYYENHRDWLGAIGRFRTVIDDYQTTTHVPEALMRLVECYLAIGTHAQAERAAAVLGANYPGTQWYQRAYKLMQEHPEQASGKGDAAMTPVSAPAQTPKHARASKPLPKGAPVPPPPAEEPGQPAPATAAGG